MSEPQPLWNDFIVTKHLGAGHRSEVRLGECGKSKFAVKLFMNDTNEVINKRQHKRYANEVSILSSLHHPNIVSLMCHGGSVLMDNSTCTATKTLYIATEYAERGSLRNLIEKSGKLSDQLARHFFKHILNALNYVHDSEFVHRDIKPENILLDDDFKAILADFDLACKISESKIGQVGTFGYMAPEVESKKRPAGIKTDIFSLGVTLYYMLTGRYLFNGTHNNVHYEAFCNCRKAFWNIYETGKGGEKLSENFKDLVTEMLEKEPSKRPTIQEVKDHPWMHGTEISELELGAERIVRKPENE